MGGAHFAQQNETDFIVIVYQVFQFIDVDYGDCEVDMPCAGATREVAGGLPYKLLLARQDNIVTAIRRFYYIFRNKCSCHTNRI